jgi:hypothetical protein
MHAGRPYCLVLDFVELGRLSPRDALEIARQLASALDHAHGFRV